MSVYMIRDVSPEVIKRAKLRAKENDTSLDRILRRFLETYAEHGHPQALGGKASMNNRTAEERSEFGRHAATKRWEAHAKDNPTDKKGT